jgi:mono/diheme cytochrome c family protein
MISARMSRRAKVLLLTAASVAVAALVTACGTEKILVSRTDQPVYRGAVLFNQRCSGCHTLSYAATNGSANNVRSAQFNNGPNFDVRCERPLTRVLYAVENGGFSGGIMPQNVVVGQDATDVAQFVATYAGTKAPKVPGVPVCSSKPVGTIPPPTATTAATTTTTTSSSTTSAKKATSKKSKSKTAQP